MEEAVPILFPAPVAGTNPRQPRPHSLDYFRVGFQRSKYVALYSQQS